ncbi:MAG: sel1 repeat family protein, partial [Gammaproteobacteria bacterium]|nr:sel1 repeat family protein [Gammaproteobacteria bacterium]
MSNPKPNTYEPDFGQLVELYKNYQIYPTAEIIRKLEVLAERGSMQSMVYIGVAYRDGRGVIKNESLAESYFVRAFEEENDIAGYYLGKHYLSQNRYQEAFKVLNKSSMYKYAPTLSCLGFLYLKGYGVEKDLHRSKELLEEASKLGNIWAKRRLADVYKSGEFGMLRLIY